MESFKINLEMAGENETLLIVPEVKEGVKSFRLLKNGQEISVLKENGQSGWEVSGQPLDATQLDTIAIELEKHLK